MSAPTEVLLQFDAAANAYAATCHTDPLQWHRPDAAEFTRLHDLLLPHAESGDARSQYALATIYWLGLCCETEEELAQTRQVSIEKATPWWIAAAAQGHWPALDNLVTSGVGPDAERARQAWAALEHERPDLVGHYSGMPVYGPPFVQELSRRLYSKVDLTLM